MTFDARWFNELRNLTGDQCERTRIAVNELYRPDVCQVAGEGYLTPRFVEMTKDLIHLLNVRGQYTFGNRAIFRAMEQHIFTFPDGHAFKRQWSIAFSAGARSNEDCARIGLGFYLASTEQHDDAILQYSEFQQAVRQRPQHFDTLMQSLDNYMEFHPDGPCVSLPSQAVLHDPVDKLPVWRFFGRQLQWNHTADRAILGNLENLVQEAENVFERIKSAGF